MLYRLAIVVRIGSRMVNGIPSVFVYTVLDKAWNNGLKEVGVGGSFQGL